MTSEARPAARIGGRAFQFEPHRCFACGELNDQGLRLQLHTDETGCRTDLVLDPRFQGWEGVAHGGILCTILDEVMAWAVIGRGVWGVTARMTVDFRRPVLVGRALRAEGTVTRADQRLFRTKGHILDPSTGEVLASSEGTYVAVPPERLAELKARYRIRPLEDRPAMDAANSAIAAGLPNAANAANAASAANSADAANAPDAPDAADEPDAPDTPDKVDR